ncbi:MAG TPA: GspH/FimT family pseudopilin [Methylophilaceae bacterium]|jgi:type IV fimbrial biogenesis protein FimT|nr:GspH/FimT family pseudopilin [Methylophilaceae bacterium]
MLTRHTKSGQFGFTLIELMIVIVIAGILLAMALPSFRDSIDRNRLRSITDTLYGDLQFAKSEAIKRNQPMTVDFTTSGGGSTWCYGFRLGSGATCDCTVTDTSATNACVIDTVLKVVNNTSEYPGITMTPSTDFVFDNVRGTATAGNVLLTSSRSKTTQLFVNVLGKIHVCSASGNSNVSGYSTSCQ